MKNMKNYKIVICLGLLFILSILSVNIASADMKLPYALAGNGMVSLYWETPINNDIYYTIYRQDFDSGSPTAADSIGFIMANELEYIDYEVENYQTYYYYITTVSNNKEKSRPIGPIVATPHNWIVYCTNLNSEGCCDKDLYLMEAQDLNDDGIGDNLISLTQTPDIDERDARISPDGTKIVFSGVVLEEEYNVEIFILYLLDQNYIVRLTTLPRSNEITPSWSLNSNELLICSNLISELNPEGDYEIFRCSSNEIVDQYSLWNLWTPLTANDYYDGNPYWSLHPDYPIIIFDSAREDTTSGFTLFRMNSDGTAQTPLLLNNNIDKRAITVSDITPILEIKKKQKSKDGETKEDIPYIYFCSNRDPFNKETTTRRFSLWKVNIFGERLESLPIDETLSGNTLGNMYPRILSGGELTLVSIFEEGDTEIIIATEEDWQWQTTRLTSSASGWHGGFGSLPVRFVPQKVIYNFDSSGWHIFTCPLELLDPNLITALEPIKNDYDIIKHWNSSKQKFDICTPEESGTDTCAFQQLEVGEFYFIHILNPTELVLNGQPPSMPITMQLHYGFNGIGWLCDDYPISNLIERIPDITTIQRWNTEEQKMEIYYNNLLPDEFGLLEYMQAYFISVASEQLWECNCETLQE